MLFIFNHFYILISYLADNKKKIDIKKLTILICIKATKMSSMIVSANEFNIKNIVYTNPKTNTVGGKSIGILNSTVKKSLYINTPMLLTYGATYFDPNKDKDSGSKKDMGVLKYDMSLQIPRDEFATPESREFLKLMKDLDEKILADASKNSVEWFGKKRSEEAIRDSYRPILKYPLVKDGERKGEADTSRAPTIKVKLPMWDGKYTFKVFDAQQNNDLVFPNDDETATPEEYIPKGCEVCCVIQCGGIYVADGKFGVTWKLYQASVKKPEKLEDNKCYVKMFDSSSSQQQQASNPQPKQTLYDSDGEDEPTQVQVEQSSSSNLEQQAPEPVEEEQQTTAPAEEPSKPVKKSVKSKK
jgi:hypothetical protein